MVALNYLKQVNQYFKLFKKKMTTNLFKLASEQSPQPFIFSAERMTPDRAFCYYANRGLLQNKMDPLTDEQLDEYFAPDDKDDYLVKLVLDNCTKKFKDRKKKLLIKRMHDKPEIKEKPLKFIRFTTPNLEILKKANINLTIKK